MADESRKRSRFGDEPSEPPRKSKFDRRSRSPIDHNNTGARRSRSPGSIAVSEKEGENSGVRSDAAAKAAAAAARINAMLSQKKLNQPAPATPVRMTVPSASPGVEEGGSSVGKDIYQQDGDYIKDIEINDLKNRYLMTKGPTQKMIKEETGAGTHMYEDVTTRGSYYPDKRMATAAQPPLYLHVTSTTKEGLEKAVTKIEELIAQALPDLVDQRRLRGRGREPDPNVELDSRGRRKWPEERISVDLEPIFGFNLRASVVGAGGANVKHIQQESGCRIQIKGRGSGYLDGETGRESDEDMYLHVTGPDAQMVELAKELCESLLVSVREHYEEFKENRARNGGESGGRGGYGDRRGGHDGYKGGRDRQSGGQSGYGGGNSYGDANAYGTNAFGAQAVNADSNAAGPLGGMDADQYNAWAHYYTQNPSADPYMAYGGFTTYMAMYSQWAASEAMGTAGSPSQMMGGHAPPAPPPEYNGGAPQQPSYDTGPPEYHGGAPQQADYIAGPPEYQGGAPQQTNYSAVPPPQFMGGPPRRASYNAVPPPAQYDGAGSPPPPPPPPPA